jgi:hypothetical protein
MTEPDLRDVYLSEPAQPLSCQEDWEEETARAYRARYAVAGH